MVIDYGIRLEDFRKKLVEFWELSANKIQRIDKNFNRSKGAPVFTIQGRYTARGWTDWTQGFQYGSALLQFDATGDIDFLKKGRKATLGKMVHHLTHTGVHDHGFNTVSTFGNLWRMMQEGKISDNKWEREYYELAMKVSGAVQATRWTPIPDGGFIYSFNGPHSLFVDTIRSLRILILSHELGHSLKVENDHDVSLFERAAQHGLTTAKYSVYYGEARDRYDERGRTAHEILFNIKDGQYRAPNSQQGYSGFSTWTRGLAWAILGFAEQMEYLKSKSNDNLEIKKLLDAYEKAACATADFYIKNTPTDGVPYWDTGDPGLNEIDEYLNKPADPFNGIVPVDSSAAAIAAQGFFRLGRFFKDMNTKLYERYFQAGLTIAKTILNEPYQSNEKFHEGLLLHSVYHFPRGWDYQPKNSKIPFGESSMWGDYHVRELAIYLERIIHRESYYTFFNGINELKYP